MSAVQFDTSGRVRRGVITPRGVFAYRPGFVRWSDLSPFTQGYVEALFASRHPADPHEGYGLRRPVLAGKAPTSSIIGWMPLGFSDVAPETLARIMEDCEKARRALNANDADGRWFWEARQRGWFTPFPPLTPYLGDDGKVCLRASS